MRIQRLILLSAAIGLIGGLLLLAVAVPPADAIPAFSRKYGTSCATCHVAFPKLNAFGEAFRRNGYRMPGGDEQYEKDEPVKLGAEPWKELWPDAIWPGDLPYLPPVSLLVDSEYMVEPGAQVNNDFRFPSDVSVLTGGTFGDTVSFYGRINLVAPGEDLHVHRLFGQLNGLFGTPLLNVSFGQFETRALPFSSSRRLTRFDYLFNTQTFPLREWMEVVEEEDEHAEGEDGHTTARVLAVPTSPDEEHDVTEVEENGHLHGGDFALGMTQQGVEVWGAANGLGGRGGLEYGFGVVNGNGSGEFAESGTNDNNSSKDIYWRAAYKFGGLSVLGDPAGAPAETKNWRDNSVRVGVFGYRGETPFGLVRQSTEAEGEHGDAAWGASLVFPEHENEAVEEVLLIDTDETFTRLGADVDIWLWDLNLFGAYLWGETRQDPLVEHGAKADFRAWFLQADYVVFPWLVGALRYERVDLPQPMLDLERWVPHVTALLRANAKFSFDAALYPDDRARDRYVFLITFGF